MNTHVFVVDSNTFKYHLEYMFAGTGASDKQAPFLSNCNSTLHATTERNLVGMIADISRIRENDNIIFYLQANGNTPGTFFGIFKASTIGFFDENDSNNYLKNELGKGLSFRIKISPNEVFPIGVTEHEYLDVLDGKDAPYKLCWSLIYRKLKANRGCTMITPFEFEDLRNKLIQMNNGQHLPNTSLTYDSSSNKIVSSNSVHNYIGRSSSIDILSRLLYKASRNNAFEAHLQAYILQSFDKMPLRQLLSINDSSNLWIGNEVSCGVGMQRIDILMIETINKNTHIRIIELKSTEPYDDIIDRQLPWYIKWVSDYLVPNYLNSGHSVYIHPCIIAKETNNTSIKNKIKNKKLSMPNASAIICPTEYICFTVNNGLSFKKII